MSPKNVYLEYMFYNLFIAWEQWSIIFMCHLYLCHVFYRDNDVLYSNMTGYHNEIKLSDLLSILKFKTLCTSHLKSMNVKICDV